MDADHKHVIFFNLKNSMKQECIPVGCVPSATVAVSGGHLIRGGVAGPRGEYLVLGGVPGPRGGGNFLTPGGGGVFVVWGVSWSRGGGGCPWSWGVPIPIYLQFS